MESNAGLIRSQYGLVKQARKVLLKYCSSLDPEHFIQTVNSFADASIHSLLIHVGNTYLHWLSRFGMKKDLDYFIPEDYKNVAKVIHLFDSVDAMVEDFLIRFESNLDVSIKGTIGKQKKEITVAAWTLLTHVITHEFHHKGQILSISRHLGYTPVDTDLIRF